MINPLPLTINLSILKPSHFYITENFYEKNSVSCLYIPKALFTIGFRQHQEKWIKKKWIIENLVSKSESLSNGKQKIRHVSWIVFKNSNKFEISIGDLSLKGLWQIDYLGEDLYLKEASQMGPYVFKINKISNGIFTVNNQIQGSAMKMVMIAAENTLRVDTLTYSYHQ